MDRREPKAKSTEWNDRPIVRVEATVMVRGELGFTPHLGYGNSRVAIYESLSRDEYLLYGYKLQDQTVTLDTLIPHRMQFTVATPIFHHWHIGGQRMGLSFNGTADARAFHRGIRVALENLEKAYSQLSVSSTSDEANSITPTSIQSFNLFDDPQSSEPCVSTNPRQRISGGTLPVPSTFRQQALSASTSRVLAPSGRSQPPRRHSSSLPGPSFDSLPSPRIPTPPPSVNEEAKNRVSNSPSGSPGYSVDKGQETFHIPVSRTIPERLLRSTPPSEVPHLNRPHDGHSHRSNHRPKRTKTPNLDHLERQRDLQPTKLNSYVQFASKRDRLGCRYAQSQYNSARIGGGDFRVSYNVHGTAHDYRYSSVKARDERFWDYGAKSFYPSALNYKSFRNPNSLLASKPPSMLKSAPSKKGGKHKEDLSERSRCRHCLALFNHDRNVPGSCPDAPTDRCERCLEYASCLPAARCVFYHCFRDSEGNYVHDPCSCSSYAGGMSRRRRWFVLGFLSLFLPCLCFYPLLKSCHRCGEDCHCCGGRHEARSPQHETQSSTWKR